MRRRTCVHAVVVWAAVARVASRRPGSTKRVCTLPLSCAMPLSGAPMLHNARGVCHTRHTVSTATLRIARGVECSWCVYACPCTSGDRYHTITGRPLRLGGLTTAPRQGRQLGPTWACMCMPMSVAGRRVNRQRGMPPRVRAVRRQDPQHTLAVAGVHKDTALCSKMHPGVPPHPRVPIQQLPG